MPYPARLPLEILNAESGEFTKVKPHLERISLLTEGGYRLRDKLDVFLAQRPGEELEVYENRISKFSYSNELGGAISQLIAKFSNGQVHIDSSDPFWAEFRADTNGQGRTEKELVSKALSEVLKFGSVFLQADKEYSEVRPLNRAQEEQISAKPRLLLHSALQIPMWAEKDGRIQWVKIYQAEEVTSPVAKPKTKVTWTFVDTESVARYSAFVRFDRRGQIAAQIDDQGNDVSPLGKDGGIPLESEVMHGFGECPITRLTLEDSLWSGNQAYPLAEQALSLECHRYALESAAYMQRTFRRPQVAKDTLDVVFEEDTAPLPTGLQYVQELDAFEWNEPQGHIITHISETLNETKKAIRSIVSVGGAYVQEGAVEASGVSKQMDFEIEENRLEAFGHLVTGALNVAYALIAHASGRAPVEVSGLDDFGKGRLADYLAALDATAKIDFGAVSQVLSPTLFMMVRERLINYLFTNLSAEQRRIVEVELKQLSVLADENPSDTLPGEQPGYPNKD